jgi:hypothetical protein
MDYITDFLKNNFFFMDGVWGPRWNQLGFRGGGVCWRLAVENVSSLVYTDSNASAG